LSSPPPPLPPCWYPVTLVTFFDSSHSLSSFLTLLPSGSFLNEYQDNEKT
jgi:hypothetical protein